MECLMIHEIHPYYRDNIFANVYVNPEMEVEPGEKRTVDGRKSSVSFA